MPQTCLFQRRPERGAALVMVAAAMFVLMILAAVGVDLASLYMVRNEAQRAADAAALAGAKMFVSTGFTSGAISQAAVQPLARQAAQAIGAQNKVGGQPAAIQPADVTFNFTLPKDPRITVVVQRSSARGNAVPTFFARVWGWLSADVRGTATAEAYNSSGGNGPVPCVGCLKPLLLPNCDPVNTSPVNPSCPGGAQGYFVDPATHDIAHTNAIGQTYQFHQQLVPSQYGVLDFSGVGGAGLRQDLGKCTITRQFSCGDSVPLLTGAKVGPASQGIEDMIHASGMGLNQGQDAIDTSTGPPFPMTAGSNNPNVLAGAVSAGSAISTSDSVVVVPLYDGTKLSPGAGSVTITGFMQIFVKQVNHQGGDDNVEGVILNVMGCTQSPPNTCSNGGQPGTITPPPAALIPVRLVQ